MYSTLGFYGIRSRSAHRLRKLLGDLVKSPNYKMCFKPNKHGVQVIFYGHFATNGSSSNVLQYERMNGWMSATGEICVHNVIHVLLFDDGVCVVCVTMVIQQKSLAR